MNRTAFITGFTGQDGTFLTKYLLDNGYRVIGLVRRVSTEPPRRIRGEFDFSEYLPTGQLVLEQGDLLSPSSLNRIIDKYLPEEIYNLGAQSHVGQSFSQPEFTMATILDGTVNLINALEAAEAGYTQAKRPWRMYQASTSEMFGSVEDLQVPVQGIDEQHKLDPNSPYAIAKTAAHQYCKMKRAQGRFIACGILFNHESEIRGGDFVTQKIARGVVRWQQTGEYLQLGNLDAQRDWGYAGDYVMAMHFMLRHETPEDFVIATGETHTVREFVEAAFAAIGETITWEKVGDFESGYTNPGGKAAVTSDPTLRRPNEVGFLMGDNEKAQRLLGWTPVRKFAEVVKIMVDAAKEGAKDV